MRNSNGKVITFLRRNAVYIVLAFCILAIGLSTTLLLINGDDKTLSNDQTVDNVKPDDTTNPGGDTDVELPGETPDVPVVTVIEFIMPVNTTEYSDFSDTMVFNSTLNRFSSHKAMDFYAEEGSSVYAVFDGTIESVENGLLTGVTVVINHGNGLKTIYNSLADGDDLVVGQKVSKGQVIGAVSITNRQEYKEGAHLHFEVEENGVLINPTKYLNLEEK